jgi:hypothetical protein
MLLLYLMRVRSLGFFCAMGMESETHQLEVAQARDRHGRMTVLSASQRHSLSISPVAAASLQARGPSPRTQPLYSTRKV